MQQPQPEEKRELFDPIDYPAVDCIKSTSSVYHGTNAVPRTPHGTVLHLDLKEGDVCNRIITVGDPARAKRIARNLDEGTMTMKSSARGFVAYKGKFAGIPVSIISIGMGMPMMDFLVRESRQIVDGPMLIVRYGTCGSLQPDVSSGSVIVASQGSVMCMRNPDCFLLDEERGHNGSKPYLVFRPQKADDEISKALVRELSAELGPATIKQGLNCSADSFYSSQGREDGLFDDRSKGLLEFLTSSSPVMSMEMETFQLFSLANSSKGSIRAAAASIAVANRPTGEVCSESVLARLELEGGKAALRAITSIPLKTIAIASKSERTPQTVPS